jgi:Fe-S oxidoreductase
MKGVLLLEKLGYEVLLPKQVESGRAWLSKGLLRKAQKIANQNIELLGSVVSTDIPLIGIEPSAILTFRDEYPDLAYDHNVASATELAKNAFLIDEFIANEILKGNIQKEAFTKNVKLIKLHGHCQQKAIASVTPTQNILSFPENYKVEIIPSGCCGMAGSFGYEKEHYDLSMQIGELVLLPSVRNQLSDTIIAATGTSCRHQIKDGTGEKALHTVEILHAALA